MNKKNKAYRKFKRAPTSANLDNLKKITSDVKSAIALAKSAYYDSFHNKIKQNPKEIWKYAKRNLKDTVSIPALVVGNTVVHEDKEKAECFNSYFKSVF